MAELTFDRLADAIAATVGAGTTVITLAGYAARGDAAPAVYVKVSSTLPNTTFTTADGFIFQLVLKGPFVDVRWFGVVIDGVTDNDLNFKKALTVLGLDNYAIYPAVSCRRLYVSRGLMVLGGGNYYVRGITIFGDSSIVSTILCTQSYTLSSVKFYYDGGANSSSPTTATTGGGMESITIFAASSTNCGYGIYMRGNATVQPDETTFQDVRVTATGGSPGAWYYPFYLYGGDRTAQPQGIRRTNMRYIFAAFASTYAYYAHGVSELNIYALGTYGGTTQTAYINGSSTSFKSEFVQIVSCNIQQIMYFDYTVASVFQGAAGTLSFLSNSARCMGLGVAGTAYNYGTGNFQKVV